MSNLRQATETALEALEKGAVVSGICILRAALAEPVQERNFCPRCGKRTNDIHTCTPPLADGDKVSPTEPVAWMDIADDGTRLAVRMYSDGSSEEVPVYTTPPQRKPLTDDEIHDCWQQRHRDKTTERRLITRAIERAHGIKDAGCDYCNHPLYAAIKCRQCGRVTE